VAALALAASAACSTGAGDRGTSAGTNPTLATEPPRTTTTSPYAVPAVIDVAYVNRVLAGLDAAVGDVTRIVIQSRTIPRDAYARLRAIYANDQRLQLAIDNYQTDMRRDFADYREKPGNKITTVTQLLKASRACVFAKVNRDYTQVGLNARPADTQWIAITPLELSRDEQGYNPTHWAYEYEGYPPDRSQPADPCVK
jgi:hypothetical protein